MLPPDLHRHAIRFENILCAPLLLVNHGLDVRIAVAALAVVGDKQDLLAIRNLE